MMKEKMKERAASFDGTLLPTFDLKELPPKEQKEYVQGAKDLLQSKVFSNLRAKLINAAGTNIIRNTQNDEEIAFNRGAIYALESLDTNLKRLTKIKV